MTHEDFIEKIGKLVDSSDKMVLIVNETVNVEAPYFTYADMQKFTYLLQRVSCEWYLYPSSGLTNGVKLKVRLL